MNIQTLNLKLEKDYLHFIMCDLRVSDNIKACSYLIKIFSKISFPLIIASDFSNSKLENEIKKFEHIEY